MLSNLKNNLSTGKVVYSNPYSHVRFHKVFDDDDYQTLLRNIPAKSHCKKLQHVDAMTEAGESRRYSYVMQPEKLDSLKYYSDKPYDTEFLIELHDTLVSREIKEIIFDLLGISCKTECYPVPIFYIDSDKYKIRPHLDKLKVATVQFYLPEDDSLKEAGTTFYEMNKNDDMWPIRKFSFLPNTGYCFEVNDKSWHGVEEIDIGDKQRTSLMLIYYTKDGYKKINSSGI